MHKKILSLLLISLMLCVLLSGFVSAQESVIVKTYESTIKPILNGIFGEKGLVQDDMLLRLAFFLLIFSVLYGVSNLVFKSYAKNTRVAITIIVSIISTAFMPKPFLYTISNLYGGVFVALLLGVPIIGGIYLMFGTLKEPTKTNYAIKFGIAAVLFYVTGRLANGVSSSNLPSSGLGYASPPSFIYSLISNIMGFAASVFFFMAIYFLIKAFTAGNGEKEKTSIEDVAENIKALKGIMGTFKRDTRIGISKIDEIIKDLGKLKGSIAANDGKADSIVSSLKSKVETVLGTGGKIVKDIDTIMKGKPSDELDTARSNILAQAGEIGSILRPEMNANEINIAIASLKELKGNIRSAVAATRT